MPSWREWSPLLPDNYYLTNFLTLVHFVGQTYADVLSPAETAWLTAVDGLDEPAQRLYVRLVCRRGSVFRRSRLRYAEIGALDAPVQALVAADLATTQTPASLCELLPMFTVPELQRLAAELCTKSMSRVAIEEALLSAQNPQVLTRLQQADQWLSIDGTECFALFRLCFFGNPYQNVSEFVMRDLGKLRYAEYPLDGHSRAFATRQQIEAHVRFFECDVQYAHTDPGDAEALLQLVDDIPALIDGDPALERRICRLRNRIARQLERLRQPRQALDLYRTSALPPSRERQVRLLEQLGEAEPALTLCNAMLSVPLDEQERQFAQRSQARLMRATGLSPPSERRFRPRTSRLTLYRSSGRVERVSRRYYARHGECFYVENSLVSGVLGLLIWDIIFEGLPGVFFNRFQAAPADFYTPQFCQRRRDVLNHRMAELDDHCMWTLRVLDAYERYHGQVNPLVHWRRLSKPLLNLAMQRIPAEHWRSLFQRVLDDPRNNGSGLPDLVLFPPASGYEFLEIKGPGDALQLNQRRWMRYFEHHAIPYRVVQVRWAPEDVVRLENRSVTEE